MTAVTTRHEQRFWALVERGPDCWTWKGTITDKGYGRIFIGGQQHVASRLSWEIHHGRIPEDFGVSEPHVCRIVNGRRRSLGPVEVPDRRKVTPEVEEAIRDMLAAGLSQSAVGRRLGLHSSTVSRVRRGVYRRADRQAVRA